MILKGNQRANGRELALHLLNVEDNEHATVYELRGFLADDLMGAFNESEAVSMGTKCEQYLFSLSLNPPPTANVSAAEFERVICEIERRMGLSGQPRAIVFHEKKGRRHAHCVWSRIDVAKMRAINLSHYKLRLQDISRELYLEHDWDMPAGLKQAQDRDPLNYSAQEASQAKRVRRDPTALKAVFKSCWDASDSQAAFAAALWEHDFCLARGDRRGFVAVDAGGEVYSLSRWCGVKAKDLRARLGERDSLPDIQTAMLYLNERQTEHARQDNATRDQEQQKAFDRKRAELVERQRQERRDTNVAQEARRIRELKALQARLPTGLKQTWARLTGQYDRICAENAHQSAINAARDAVELQAQVETHLKERHVLDRDRELNAAHNTVRRDLRDTFTNKQPNGYASDPRQPLILPPEPRPFTRAQIETQPDLILGHINDKKAMFTQTEILRGLTEYINVPFALRVACDQVMRSSEIVRVGGSQNATYTTREYQAVERELTAATHEMTKLGGFSVKPSFADQAIAAENTKLQVKVGADLSGEQIQAIRHILAPNQLSAVVGLAGAGKSTLLSVARAAWEKQGYKVYGAALAGKAADSLQSASGIFSRTLASLEASWKSGYEPVSNGSVVVIDEAGMVGTRQLARVTEQLQKRGCKLVLVGDPDQLQPIQAGTPFRDVVGKIDAARLTEIRRQTTDWQRCASHDFASGDTSKALRSYSDHGAVHVAEDRDHAIAKLVDDYIADWQWNGNATSRLALAHRRKDVHAINQAIKSALAAQDNKSPVQLFQTDHGPRAFANGDRILFTRNNKTLGVRNGMLATVTRVGDDKLSVAFDPDNSGKRRHFTFSPSEFSSIDHGFAVSIHRSQGCTVDRSFVLSSRTLDGNLTYVAMTRHKLDAKFYVEDPFAPRKVVQDAQKQRRNSAKPTRSR